MENKKTIIYFNSKAWYRLLKVFFGIGFLIVLVIFNIIVFSGGVKKIDQNNTIIKCNVSNKNTFSPASINITLNNSDFEKGQFNYKNFFEGYNDYSIMEILKGCGNTPVFNGADSYDQQKAVELVNNLGLIGVENKTQEQKNVLGTEFDKYWQQTKNVFGNNKVKYLDFSFNMFDITPVFTYDDFLKLFLIGNFIILAIFEVIKRIFHYIVLGSIKPKE